VIFDRPGRRGWDNPDVTDHGLRYFDDYRPGATYDCGSVSVDQAGIISFAKEFDPQPFHVDPEAAARGPYGGLIASGWHTAVLLMRQLVEHYVSAEASLGSPGLDEIRWPYPVRPGDTLRVRATVVEARRSLSKPDRGIVRTVAEAVNQDARPVMRATAINFFRVRPAPDA
jgi:acyl dehydratase